MFFDTIKKRLKRTSEVVRYIPIREELE